jgi:flagellar biosynthesis protein FliR
MLQALASSYAALPIGAGAVGGKDLAEVVTDTLGSVFLIGVRIAAPVVLVLLVVEVAMALATRAMPQLNLMVIGAPVRLLVGLFVLGVTLAAVPEVVLMAVEPALRLAARLASAVAPH